MVDAAFLATGDEGISKLVSMVMRKKPLDHRIDTYSYGDIISESKMASIDVEFDVSGLVVNATDITLSDDKLIF